MPEMLLCSWNPDDGSFRGQKQRQTLMYRQKNRQNTQDVDTDLQHIYLSTAAQKHYKQLIH